MGWGSIVKAVTKVTGFFKNMNPLVSLGVTLFLSWVLRPKVPDMPDPAASHPVAVLTFIPGMEVE